jgi:hypothetical protein
MDCRLGVPRGEWKGEDGSLNRGAAMARFDFVRIIEGGGPMAPKGEAEYGASDTTSFHASLADVCLADARGALGILGDGRGEEGLNVAAFALSILGDAMSESPEVSDAGAP